MNSTELLERLRQAGVTQKAIGEVIGVSQPNVATLYGPARNGKPRKLTWDEGQALIAAFPDCFDSATAEPDTPTISAEALTPLLDALLPLIPPRATAQSVEALSEGLAYGLRLLGGPHANPPSHDAYAVAARAASARFRDLVQQ